MEIFIIILAATILISMLVAKRTILYVNIRGKEWKWAPTKEDDPWIYWFVIVKLLVLIIYFSIELFFGGF